MSSDEQPLPPLIVAELDDELLAELFGDVEALGEELEIVVKRGPEVQVDGAPRTTLLEAERLLRTEMTVGVQLRYRYRGSDWWDTILRSAEGFRLVRIEHPIAATASRESATNGASR